MQFTQSWNSDFLEDLCMYTILLLFDITCIFQLEEDIFIIDLFKRM